MVEFETNVKVEDAKQKVKDAVDKAKTDLPTDLTNRTRCDRSGFL